MSAGTQESPQDDRRLEIRGTVQGVGFRPFVAGLARRLGLRGWVRNDRRGVIVRVMGDRGVIDAFVAALVREAPTAARIEAVREAAAADTDAAVGPGFAILESARDAVLATVAITPDLALCDSCRRELADPADRRHAYPFINCTHCGPRYTILWALPYDRARTTMAEFTLCLDCAREYGDPGDRRYHAEPNACPVCGPRVELQDRTGRVLAQEDDAIEAAAAALRAGRIVAAKGLGGFHLLCDATSETAVTELRRRKLRAEKPFAVMFATVSALRECAVVGADEERQLTSPAAPIVLVARRPGCALAEAVAPANPWVGALLAHAPLQVLLLERVGRPVVATSGNLSEEPLCTDNLEARERLGDLADLFLMHNRVIARPVDDSVVRPALGDALILRRARGLAPAPVALPSGASDAGLLCVGAHQKNTVAVTVGENLVLSPHIGDLGTAVAAAAFRRTIDWLAALHGSTFSRVACDAHPDYASTRYAESLGLPVVRVQHHLAHILSCLLEHGAPEEPVLGVAWDGTGYGTDGTIWGGEFIVVDPKHRSARRAAHLRPFRLPGGEAAVREPRRSALGVLHALGAGHEAAMATLEFTEAERAALNTLLDRGVAAPVTTSAGRLFDAVAALLGVRQRCSFEGQAAMELEVVADGAGSTSTRPWPMPLGGDNGLGGVGELDWRPMLAALLEARADMPTALLSAQFHRTLAGGIAEVATSVGLRNVVLTGGCFQNVRLLEETTMALTARGHHVLRHHLLPPNDGGIAAGQALAALWGVSDVKG